MGARLTLEASAEALKEREKWTAANPGFKKIALPVIAVLFALDVVGMLVLKLRGGDATALLGGTVGIVMVFVALGGYGKEGFEKLTEHTRAGFQFGIRIFAPVLLIAAFFFMGSPGTAKAIFGDGAKGLLAMRQAGARTLGQDEQSSVVYGMPRAVIEDGLADLALPLGELAEAIAAEAGA